MLKVKWAQLNETVGNVQSSPNMWLLYWCDSGLGIFKRFRHLTSETWGFQPRVGVVIPAFCPLLHNSFTQLCLILQLFLFKGSSCLALSCFLSSFTQEILFFFHFYVWMDFCWPVWWVKILWNSCHSLVQLVQASLSYLKALETA